jgi:hypothetical protein
MTNTLSKRILILAIHILPSGNSGANHLFVETGVDPNFIPNSLALPSKNNSMFALFARHSRAGGNPLWLGRWIPAFAGMTNSLVAGFLQT